MHWPTAEMKVLGPIDEQTELLVSFNASLPSSCQLYGVAVNVCWITEARIMGRRVTQWAVMSLGRCGWLMLGTACGGGSATMMMH